MPPLIINIAAFGTVIFSILGYSSNIYLLGISFLAFAILFIFLQSTLISTAQEKLPHMKGTAMSIASFNMFVGIIASILVANFTKRKVANIKISEMKENSN